jgi:hypothetical protein
MTVLGVEALAARKEQRKQEEKFLKRKWERSCDESKRKNREEG